MGRCLVGLFLGRNNRLEISSCFSSIEDHGGYFQFSKGAIRGFKFS